MTVSVGRRCCRGGPWRSGRGASAALPHRRRHRRMPLGVRGWGRRHLRRRRPPPVAMHFKVCQKRTFRRRRRHELLVGFDRHRRGGGRSGLRRWRRRRHHFPKRALPHKGGGAGPPGGGGGGGIPLASAAAERSGRRGGGSAAGAPAGRWLIVCRRRSTPGSPASGEGVGDGEPRRRAREQDRDQQRHLGLELLSALRRRCFADVVDDGRLSYGVGQRVDLVDRAEEAGLGIGVGFVRELGDQSDASVVDLRVGRAGVDHPVAVHQPSLHHRVSRSRIRQQLERQLGEARAAAAVSRALERDDRRRVARSPLRRALHLAACASSPHTAPPPLRPLRAPSATAPDVPSGAPPWTCALAPVGAPPAPERGFGADRPRPRCREIGRPPSAPPALPPAPAPHPRMMIVSRDESVGRMSSSKFASETRSGFFEDSSPSSLRTSAQPPHTKARTASNGTPYVRHLRRVDEPNHAGDALVVVQLTAAAAHRRRELGDRGDLGRLGVRRARRRPPRPSSCHRRRRGWRRAEAPAAAAWQIASRRRVAEPPFIRDDPATARGRPG